MPEDLLESRLADRRIGGSTSDENLMRVPTPLDVRADRLLCASRLMELANKVARHLSGVATTGILSHDPGGINTIPSSVNVTLDNRHMSDDALDEMEAC
jgi:N-carbamoyl-L-amino-acid hydrolase